MKAVKRKRNDAVRGIWTEFLYVLAAVAVCIGLTEALEYFVG